MDSIIEDAIGETDEDGEAPTGESAPNDASADVKGSGTMTDEELAEIGRAHV